MRKSPSFENAEAPPLRFDTQQDALDYAAEIAQDDCGWLGLRDGIVEAYKNGHLELVVTFRVGLAYPTDWHISIRSRMVDLVQHRVESELCCAAVNDDFGNVHLRPQQGLVLLVSGKFVESPKGDIPSAIWLKRGHEVEHLFGDVFRPVASLAVQIESVLSKREMGVLATLSSGLGDEVPGMVERVPEVYESVAGKPADPVWKLGRWPEESQLVSWINRIVLNDQGIRLTLNKAASEYIDFIDVRLGVLDRKTADF